jgi:peptidylprolyl isomerase
MKLDRRQFAAGAAALAGLSGEALAQAADADNTVYLETKNGRVTIRLRPDLAPKHVAQIKTLTKQGFYNGAPFHRVIEGFMAQTGDSKNKNGTGGSDLPNVPAEFTQTPFKRGTVGMARSQQPNSASSSSASTTPRFSTGNTPCSERSPPAWTSSTRSRRGRRSATARCRPRPTRSYAW